MAILLVILIIGAGMLIAMLNGSEGRTSAFGDSLTIAIVVVVAIIASVVFDLQAKGVAVVGVVPAGLPRRVLQQWPVPAVHMRIKRVWQSRSGIQ